MPWNRQGISGNSNTDGCFNVDYIIYVPILRESTMYLREYENVILDY